MRSVCAQHILRDAIDRAAQFAEAVLAPAQRGEDQHAPLVRYAIFPEAFKPFATLGIAFLEALRQTDDVDWTFFSPAADIFEGPRTGSYRGGTDQLVTDAQGESRISFADFAIAMIDELEAHKYPHARFTAAY